MTTMTIYRHARDISDELFLAAIEEARTRRGAKSGFSHSSATRWDIEAVLGGGAVPRDFSVDLPGVPSKVVLAKASRLIKRGVIDGCTCGCRGDFRLTTAAAAGEQPR